MFKILPARPEDARALSHLAQRTFVETFARYNAPEEMEAHCQRSFGTEIQEGEIRNPRYQTFMAWIDGKAAGFCQVRDNPKPSLASTGPNELYRIYVDSAYHGQGVAKGLMEQALDWARGRQTKALWLGVHEDNQRAMAFYKKFGFEVIGKHTFVLGNEPQQDLVMLAEV